MYARYGIRKIRDSQFPNYRYFCEYCEEVSIYHQGQWYYVIPKGESDLHKYIFMGSKEEVNAWLYGCVQAVNGIVKKKKEYQR